MQQPIEPASDARDRFAFTKYVAGRVRVGGDDASVLMGSGKM